MYKLVVTDAASEKRHEGSELLKTITILRKICNSSSLFLEEPTEEEVDPLRNTLKALATSASLRPFSEQSVKLGIVEAILQSLARTPGTPGRLRERVVIMSYFTEVKGTPHQLISPHLHYVITFQTLAILQSLIASLGHECDQLDGSMTSAKRCKIVDSFNSPQSNVGKFAFCAVHILKL